MNFIDQKFNKMFLLSQIRFLEQNLEVTFKENLNQYFKKWYVNCNFIIINENTILSEWANKNCILLLDYINPTYKYYNFFNSQLFYILKKTILIKQEGNRFEIEFINFNEEQNKIELLNKYLLLTVEHKYEFKEENGIMKNCNIPSLISFQVDDEILKIIEKIPKLLQ